MSPVISPNEIFQQANARLIPQQILAAAQDQCLNESIRDKTMHDKAANPYENLPDNKFWKKGVMLNSPKIHDIFTQKFSLTKQDPIATAGHALLNTFTRR